MFDADETRMIGLPYREKKLWQYVKPFFYIIPERDKQTDRQTDGQTDEQTDNFAISISRVSVLTRDKNPYRSPTLVVRVGSNTSQNK